jgi:hypothetical protein
MSTTMAARPLPGETVQFVPAANLLLQLVTQTLAVMHELAEVLM